MAAQYDVSGRLRASNELLIRFDPPLPGPVTDALAGLPGNYTFTAADAGVDIVTIGQYLQPSAKHAQIDRWVHPDEFVQWKIRGEAQGI